MAHRRVVDQDKQVWDVWEVIPASVHARSPGEEPQVPRVVPRPRGIVVPPELQSGWLAMQCGAQRRRIAPLPAGWNDLTDDALLDLLATATSVIPRRTSGPHIKAE